MGILWLIHLAPGDQMDEIALHSGSCIQSATRGSVQILSKLSNSKLVAHYFAAILLISC